METWVKAFLIFIVGAASLTFLGCGGGSAGPSPPPAGPSPPPAVHNEWTWMGGSEFPDAAGFYGTQGVASADNSPGARLWACSWTDRSGNFWLFGGLGFASTQQSNFNDLWEYNNGQWAWMGGLNQSSGRGSRAQLGGIYGTMGVPAPGNWPGARYSATCWTDPQGNFWLYGGMGLDSTESAVIAGPLGDLWRYSNGEWTWMAGSEIAGSSLNGTVWGGQAVYGTKGVAAPNNTPGVRQIASGWADSSGNLWLFGGLGVVPNGTPYGLGGSMTDLWKFTPSTGNGRGWRGRTRSIRTALTEPSELPPPVTLPGHVLAPLRGPMRQAISGSLGDRAPE